MPGQFLTETLQWFIHSVSLRHLWGHEVVFLDVLGEGRADSSQGTHDWSLLSTFHGLQCLCVGGEGHRFWGANIQVPAILGSI